MSKEETQSETPEPAEAPAAATDETDVSARLTAIENTLADVNTALDTFSQILVTQQQQIETVASRDPVMLPEEAVAPKLHGVPEGTTRFFSPTKEYTIWIRPAENTMVNGKVVYDRGQRADFSNGIFDTRDAELAEYLRNHPAHGVEYWEAPDAQPHPGVQVVEGPKTTGSRAAARPPEELAARL